MDNYKYILFVILISYNFYNFYITNNYEVLNTNSVKAYSIISLISSILLFILLHIELSKIYLPANHLYAIPILLCGLLIIFNILNTKYIFSNDIKLVKLFNSFNFILVFILLSILMFYKINNKNVLDEVDKLLYEAQNPQLSDKFFKNEKNLDDDIKRLMKNEDSKWLVD